MARVFYFGETRRWWSWSVTAAGAPDGGGYGAAGRPGLTLWYTGLWVFIGCSTAPDEVSLVLDGETRVHVERLGAVPMPRVRLNDGTVPRGVLYRFSKPGVAVHNGREMMALGPGEVEVTAEWEGQSVAWTLEVELVTVLKFLDPPARLRVGESVALTVLAQRGDETRPVDDGVRWTCSNPAALQIEAGQARAIAPGMAYVTAHALGAKAMVELEVRP